MSSRISSLLSAREWARRSACAVLRAPRQDFRRMYAAAAQRKVDDLEESESQPPLAPRNPVGVQLLSRPLHAQVFPHVSAAESAQANSPPPLHPEALSLSLAHLRTHGLDPSQAAVLKPTAFTLPQLQGANLAEHFWQIGREAAQPWLSLAEDFAALPQERETFSQSTRPSLLAAPSSGSRADAEDADNIGHIPPEEWLALDPAAQSLLHPQRPQWKWQSGWTMYPFLSASGSGDAAGPRALGEGHTVDHPPRDDPALVFDVEVLVNAGPWPVMATALGMKGWYAWLSPWLVGDSDTNEHLVPFGSSTRPEQDTSPPRLLVGHNVGYDRARVLDEYSIERPNIRYLDTMSLHVAVRGISSPQRPAYMKKRKERQQAADALAAEERELKMMAKEEVKRLLAETLGIEPIQNDSDGAEDQTLMDLLEDDNTDRVAAEIHALFEVGDTGSFSGSNSQDGTARAEAAAAVTSIVRGLQAKRAEVAAAVEAEAEADVASELDSSTSSPSASVNINDSVSPGAGAVEWHEVTSRNSLLEVAALHCNIRLNKDIRDTFVDPSTTVETLRNDWVELLNYCASDTAATHSVLQAVLPAFRKQCPHPATFAGVLGMGSMILPVRSDEWVNYKDTSEAIWKKMSDEVETALMQRAEEVMREGVGRRSQVTGDPAVDFVEQDPWLQQLDWTPKKPKLRRLKPESGAQTTSTASVDPHTLDTATHITVPKWYRDAASKTKSKSGLSFRSSLAASVLQLRYQKRYVIVKEGTWVAILRNKKGKEVKRIDLGSTSPFAKSFKHGEHLSSATSTGQVALDALAEGRDEDARDALERATWELVALYRGGGTEASAVQSALADHDLSWEWVSVERARLPHVPALQASSTPTNPSDNDSDKREITWWPKWYWDIIKIPRLPASEAVSQQNDGHRGHHPYMDLSIRSKIAPLLLQLSWKGFPLFHSREYGWTYRQTRQEGSQADEASSSKRSKALTFKLEADRALQQLSGEQGAVFLKLPHASGEDANVGSPFSKSFMPYFENKTLQAGHAASEDRNEVGEQKSSGSEAAQKAMALNTECAYWVSARDRIMNQVVVRHGQAGTTITQDSRSEADRDNLAVILPQVITMGTITRRAIERTWLTASNAKKNRVGSELKSMVKAPPGWSIVGADVDSEELWICSVMGDAQFGMHGATAVGWMTLEGTKALGTDLHSKTASILGTSRNQAKVFNYSRIYGAGIKHATQLMLKANPKLSAVEAGDRAKALYRATKGLSTQRQQYFGRKFWHGGTESYVFNKLEAIALSDNPQTPALDCGITAALSREYLPKAAARDSKFGEDYMPSRINWVVQSSGVDYLHLLISSMEHLCKKYDIAARFMLSVHDEVRYLCREEDRYRTALALQISNLWTRSMFAYKLEMDDLPQSCAFFAQVDIDHVLRKEVDDPCVTPSHPTPIPNGEAQDIEGTLARTNCGSLYADGRPMEWSPSRPISELPDLYPPYRPSHQNHRSVGSQGQYYLEAQATSDINEIRALDKQAKVKERMGRSIDTAADRKRAGPARRARKVGKEDEESSRPVTSAEKESQEVGQAGAEEAWLDLCATSAGSDKKPPLRRSTTKRSSTLTTATQRPKLLAGTQSKAASFSTFSGKLASLNTTKASLLHEIEDMCALIPARHTIRGPGRPFYKFREHRVKILWGLYRPILRLLPEDCPTLRAYLRARFHLKKRLVTLTQTKMMMEQAERWLDVLKAVQGGSAEALEHVQTHERRLLKQAKRHAAREREVQFYNDIINPPPKPRISGSIMRPSKEHPPLPRFKPVQPIDVTMMIFRRKRQRTRIFDRLKDTIYFRDTIDAERRAERGLNAASISTAHAGADSTAQASIPGPNFSDPRWAEPIVAELASINATNARSKQREQLPVPLKILQNAKKARRERHRAARVRKIREVRTKAEDRAKMKARREAVRAIKAEGGPVAEWQREVLEADARTQPVSSPESRMRRGWWK